MKLAATVPLKMESDSNNSPQEDIDEFFQLVEQARLEFINNQQSLPCLNGCIHEADRLLRLAFEDENIDAAVRESYQQLITAQFYFTYADCLLMFGSLSDNLAEIKIATDLASDMYEKSDAESVLYKTRTDIIYTMLQVPSESEVMTEIENFFSAFDMQSLQFYYSTWLIFKRIFLIVYPGGKFSISTLYQKVSAAVKSEQKLDCFGCRIVAEIHLKSVLEGCVDKADFEDVLETALDFVEQAIDESVEMELLDHFVCNSAINALVLLEYHKQCGKGKEDKITEMILFLLQDINCYPEITLPSEFESHRQEFNRLTNFH